MAGQYIANLYDEMERQVVADIARRVSKTDRFTETAEIQAKALRAQGYSPAQIQAEVMKQLNANNDYLQFVAENTRAYKQEVKEIIKATVAQAVIDGDDLVATAGEMAWNDDLQVWQDHGVDLKKDNTLRQIQKAYTEQTVGELKNITRTSAMEVGGVPILDAYHHELDLAVLKTASGTFTFQQSMEDCCRRLGNSGVQVKYPSGKKYSLEAATRMTVKTGLSQLSGKITEENMKKTSTDLVYVSAHAGSRPEHAEWQGKVYTYKGKPSRKYPDFIEATGYGTVTGLKGVNCSHSFYPWWEGDEIPEFHEPEPVTIDGKEYTYYEATQKQRQMERSVRNMKREKAAAEAAGDTQKAEELEKKMRATRQEYNAFSKQAGLRPKTERMRIFDSDNNNPGSTSAKITPPTPAKAKSTAKAAPEEERKPMQTVKFKDAREATEYFRGSTYDSRLGTSGRKNGWNVRPEDNKPATKWENKLTHNQKEYITSYTGDNYDYINKNLRGLLDDKEANEWIVPPNEMLTGKKNTIKAHVEQIDKALDKYELKENLTVYRTCEREFLDQIKVGSIFHDDGYGSTSVVPVPVASGDVFFEIGVPKGKGVGAYVDGLSWKECEEFEFLLGRGADYKIIEIKEEKDGVHIKAEITGFTKKQI